SGVAGGLRVWQLPSGRELGSFKGHQELVTELAFAAGGKLMSVGAEGTVLIWDTSTLKTEVKDKPAKIDADTGWTNLAGDAAGAYETMARLGDSPEAAITLLRQRLKPAENSEAKRIDQLIVQLDDDEFDKREEASRELEKLGSVAEGALRKAAKAK